MRINHRKDSLIYGINFSATATTWQVATTINIRLIMATKRVRGPNFSAEECFHMSSIIKQFSNIIENKKTDGVTWAKKRKAWIQIAELFNATSSAGLHRTVQQLNAKYITLKKSLKKRKSTLKQEEFVIDGGPYKPPKFEDGDVLDSFEMLMPDANGGLSTKSDSDPLYEGPDDLVVIDTNSGNPLNNGEDVCIDLPKLTPTSLQPPASDDEGQGLLDLDEEAEMDSLIGKHNLPVILELDDNNSTAGSSTESRRQTPSATFKQAASSVNSKKFASMVDAKKDLAILQMELLKREYKLREAHMIEIHELDVKIKRAQLEILLDQKKVDVARL